MCPPELKIVYCKDDRYLVLVVGPFAHLSDPDEFSVLSYFLGRVRALKAMNSWDTNLRYAFAMNWYIVVSHFGHLAASVC